MKTSLWIRKIVKTDSKSCSTLSGLLLGTALVSTSLVVGAADRFQLNTLFNPSKVVLQTEARGRVMIYDGLDEADVDRALDEQFERIEHMMFTHTRKTEPDGTVSIEDDGC